MHYSKELDMIRLEALKCASMIASGYYGDNSGAQTADTMAKKTIDMAKFFEQYIRNEM